MQDTRTINDTTGLLQDGWSYMPGVVHRDGVLYVQPVGGAIVRQDGSGGRPNPPVNLFGTHLEGATKFALTATIRDITDTATLQLYGQTPIIADEFRVERRSIQLTVTKDSVQARLWDGTGQQPAATKDFPLQHGKTVELKIAHRDNKLTFYADDAELGSLSAAGVFANKTVWFGMDGTNKWTLSELDVHALDGTTVRVVDGSSLAAIRTESSALQRLASQRRPGFTIGAAMALGPAASDKEYAAIAFGGNFGALTTENALKWQSVHPQPGTYTFQEADALVTLAQRHQMAIHGHALVFGEANPRWVQALPTQTPEDKAHVKQVMLEHITKVVGHYKGKVSSWDVVNEPFDEDDWSKLRPHLWHKAMGTAYIEEAFRAAHKADPDALLFINDWALEMDPDRWAALLTLLKDLKAKHVPIHGVGFQAHVYHADDRIDTKTLTNRMQQLADLGLKSRIAEIDVYASDGQLVQAMQYADVLEACLKVPSCVSYTTWGISDRYNTYQDDEGVIQFGKDFLWTADMKPTPAVTELQRVLTTK